MANPTPPSSTPTGVTTFQRPPTLAQIQNKVRRLTRTPSTSQLSDADLNNYINTFVVYDFPEQLRTFNLKTQFTFFTNAFQDTYNTDILSFAGAVNNPLYNFQNLYLSISPPVYIAGFQTYYTQDREQFFSVYPILNSISFTGFVGNGITTNYSGVINSNQAIIPPTPNFVQQIVLIPNNVLFSSVGSNFQGVALADIPVVDPTTGNQTGIGNLYDPNSANYRSFQTSPPTIVDPTNNVNYITGAYNITFTTPPGPGYKINSQTVPYGATLPQSMLFHNNQFTLRPVPDQPYRINFEVFQRPTALLANGQAPELEEYWQYIAYGASKKIFEDRMDLDSVQLIMPELKTQERLCLRRTIVQLTNERTATIYAQQYATFNLWGGFYGPGLF